MCGKISIWAFTHVYMGFSTYIFSYSNAYRPVTSAHWAIFLYLSSVRAP